MPLSQTSRRGISVTELIVAIALLTVLTSAIGQYVTYVNRAVRMRELMQDIRWELENARESIGSWRSDEITEQRIQEISFSTTLREHLQDPSWVVEILPARIHGLEQAESFRTVRLGITAGYLDQTIHPVSLIFWVPNTNAHRNDAGSQFGQMAEEMQEDDSTSTENLTP